MHNILLMNKKKIKKYEKNTNNVNDVRDSILQIGE